MFLKSEKYKIADKVWFIKLWTKCVPRESGLSHYYECPDSPETHSTQCTVMSKHTEAIIYPYQHLLLNVLHKSELWEGMIYL